MECCHGCRTQPTLNLSGLNHGKASGRVQRIGGPVEQDIQDYVCIEKLSEVLLLDMSMESSSVTPVPFSIPLREREVHANDTEDEFYNENRGVSQGKAEGSLCRVDTVLELVLGGYPEGSAFLLVAFLKGKDATLTAKRKAVRDEIGRLAADPNEQVRRLAKYVSLESVEKPQSIPHGEASQGVVVPH